MGKYKIVKKIFCVILLIILISLIIVFTFNKKEKKIIEVYSSNQSGQMRDEKRISDETFDEYGNLTHYKYKEELADGTIKEKEYNIKYEFDSEKRITKVQFDDNFIDIKYNDENKISKLTNQVKNEMGFEEKHEYDFTYNDSNTEVKSVETYNFEDGYKTTKTYILTPTTINNENYLKCSVVDENGEEIEEFLYKVQDKQTNYNNVFSLLNIEFEGYISFYPNIKHTNFNINIPIFNSGNIVYLKDLSARTNNDLSSYYYYDSSSNILKCDMPNKNSIYNMYKYGDSKERYGYSIEKNNESYTYIEYKDYLNDDNTIYKREILETKSLSEKEYQKELKKFEQYFDRNNKTGGLYEAN